MSHIFSRLNNIPKKCTYLYGKTNQPGDRNCRTNRKESKKPKGITAQGSVHKERKVDGGEPKALELDFDTCAWVPLQEAEARHVVVAAHLHLARFNTFTRTCTFTAVVVHATSILHVARAQELAGTEQACGCDRIVNLCDGAVAHDKPCGNTGGLITNHK